jgi:hypothetical protein
LTPFTDRSVESCQVQVREKQEALKEEKEHVRLFNAGVGERRTLILRPEILALKRPAAGGAVLYLLCISFARLYIVEEDPSVMPLGVPELRPQFVRLAARAIQRCHLLLPPR